MTNLWAISSVLVKLCVAIFQFKKVSNSRDVDIRNWVIVHANGYKTFQSKVVYYQVTNM
jgi:hypothetical protein